MGLNDRLYVKMRAEYDNFIMELKEQPPQIILMKSYEKTLKENLLRSMETGEISSYQIKPLLSEEKPLECVYQKWLDDYGLDMDVLRDCVSESASDLLERQSREKAPRVKEERER
jgi:hypothetical protein